MLHLFQHICFLLNMENLAALHRGEHFQKFSVEISSLSDQCVLWWTGFLPFYAEHIFYCGALEEEISFHHLIESPGFPKLKKPFISLFRYHAKVQAREEAYSPNSLLKLTQYFGKRSGGNLGIIYRQDGNNCCCSGYEVVSVNLIQIN